MTVAVASLIVIILFQAIILSYQIVYLLKFYKNQVHYPLKQLSPTITLHQGIFLIISQILMLIEIFMFLNQCELENQVKEFIAFFYTFSRGCCFSFAFLKTARITVAFNKNILNPQSAITKYCSSEKRLLLSGYIYSFIGFPLLSFITTYTDSNSELSDWLENYHNNLKYIMINSIIEELLCIILMGYIIFYHLEDKLYKLTFNVLVCYMVWFIVFSLIDKITSKIAPKCYQDLINFIVTLSYLLRAYLMFYLYVRQPIKQIERHPTLYLNSNKIENFSQISSLRFQGHYSDSIILHQFEDYLKDLDQQDKNRLNQFQSTINFCQFKQHQLYKIYITLCKKLDEPAPMNIIEDYLINEFNNHEILHQQDNSPEKLEQNLRAYLSKVYQNGFKNTNSFHTINNYYYTQETAVKNLQTLGISLDEYDPLKE